MRRGRRTQRGMTFVVTLGIMVALVLVVAAAAVSQRARFQAMLTRVEKDKAQFEAPTRADAMRLAMKSGLAVLDLAEEKPASAPRHRKITRDHAILLLRQLSVMIGAGVQLLDAIETLAASLPGAEAAERLRLTAQALRRGDRFGDALAASLPIYPAYVYGLVRAGETSGKLARVLEEAAQQLSFERRVERDILNALTYPAFLVVSGAGSVGFLLYFVVPRSLISTSTIPSNSTFAMLGPSSFIVIQAI